MMDYMTLRNKYKAMTRFDDYSVDVMLGIEMSDGGLDGAIAFINRTADYMRMHTLAESLERLGHDPLDALEAMYDAYECGGVIRMESLARQIEQE